MRFRWLILPLVAVLLFGLSEYKLSQEYEHSAITSQHPLRPAPDFEALDVNGKVFRLRRYLGRQALLLVFYDGKPGRDHDPALHRLLERAEPLRDGGLVVIAVSSSLPQENRRLEWPKPFVPVTDVEPFYKAHRIWGCFDEEQDLPRAAVFYVNRAGHVATRNGLPIPLEESAAAIDGLLEAAPKPM